MSIDLNTLDPVKFVNQAIPQKDLPNGEDYTCPVCWSQGDSFIAHQKLEVSNGNRIEVFDGEQHPIHRACVKTWLERNSTCPSCRIPIENTLVGPGDRVLRHVQDLAANTREATQEIEGSMIFGATTLALMAAIEFAGIKGAKDILAITGAAYGASAILFGALYGTYGITEISYKKTASYALAGATIGAALGMASWYAGFTPNGSRAEVAGFLALGGLIPAAIASIFVGGGSRSSSASSERIASTISYTHMGGIAMGTLFWYFGLIHNDRLPQIAGIAGIANATGLLPMSVGLGLGTLTGAVLQATKWFGKNTKETIAAISAGSTAIALRSRNTCPTVISGLSVRFAYKAATTFAKAFMRQLGQTQTLILAGAIAGAATASSAVLLNRAYPVFRTRTTQAYHDLRASLERDN